MFSLLFTLLMLVPTPGYARNKMPAIRIEEDNFNKRSARAILTNVGDARGTFNNLVIDAKTGEQLPVKVFPSRVSLASGRRRIVRFSNLPLKPVYICSTVEVSPSLDLRSCLLREL